MNYKNIPVPEDVHAKLRKLAFKNQTSMAKMVRLWVESLTKKDNKVVGWVGDCKYYKVGVEYL